MKNIAVFTSNKYVIIGFFILLGISQISAQSLNVYQLFEEDFQQSSSKIATKSSTFIKSNVDVKQGFFTLKKGLKPTIYVDYNKVKQVTGDVAPLILKYENSYSLNILKENNTLINKVELLTIKLKNQNEINNRFDFSSIEGFDNLKYIFIQCNFDCTANDISSFILNVDPKVTIFYMVSNPS
ncbi:MAG: hypothetical protein QM495_10285 [Lutibacter sp.]|uniref:hypothetical protein n=1 Tax=Lutibacter sp. TaxID=1925666 RepID=UPI00385D13A6